MKKAHPKMGFLVLSLRASSKGMRLCSLRNLQAHALDKRPKGGFYMSKRKKMMRVIQVVLLLALMLLPASNAW